MSDLVPRSSSGVAGPDYGDMQGGIVALLEAAHHAAARSVNALMTASYWEIGRRIVDFEQAGQERAAYGQALLKRLSVDLTQRFGRGFSERNLEQMQLFYLAWPPERISQTPSAKSATTRTSQTVSGESSVPAVRGAPTRTSATLSTLAQAFPLPWSAYVRLLSVKSEAARALLSTVRAGDFIYPKLMAWEGALGVVPPECDRMVVSPQFPVFTVNTEAVLPELLDIYFRTPDIWPALAEISGGTNARRHRLQPGTFLSYEMLVPSMAKQLELRAIYQRTQLLKAKHAAIRKANAALLPATLERVFAASPATPS